MSLRRTLRSLVVALLVAVPVAAAGSSVLAGPADELSIPAGFRVVDRSELLPGVVRYRLSGGTPPVVLNVARIAAGAPVSLRAVLSNDRIGAPQPGLERTSAMCRRVGCVVGVNADFFAPDGAPVGALVSNGELLRSPVPTHHQLAIDGDGALSAGSLDWSGRLVASDLSELRLTGLNTVRPANSLVLYSPAFGPTTGTNEHGAEMALHVVEPARSVRVAETVLVEMSGLNDGAGNRAIPRDGLVLSGHGVSADAIRGLAARVQSGAVGPRFLLRAELAPTGGSAGVVRESVGGTPVLLRDGKRWVADHGSDFVTGRHPRTAVAWRPGGATLLVTVDGRQPGYSEGASLPQLADLLSAMGATDAVNLDGGGSTTFVERGVVMNQPSDRLVTRGDDTAIVHSIRGGDSVLGVVERPIGSGLMLVASVPAGTTGPDALVLDPRLPQALFAPWDSGADPASDPSAGAPALVATVPEHRSPPVLALALVLLCSVAVAAARSLKLQAAR